MAQESDIPSRIIKEKSDTFGEYLLSSFNDAIDKSYFPAVLKQANITPALRQGERYSKDNYRPLSILPNMSKNFEKKCFVKCLIKFFQKRIQHSMLPFQYAWKMKISCW